MKNTLKKYFIYIFIFGIIFGIIMSFFCSRFIYNGCRVKVSQNGLYHIEGSRHYNRIQEYKCFDSILEAESYGFKRSK